MRTNAYIRVDGSSTIGSGHLVRCVSVALYLKTQKMNVLFITRSKNIVKYILENDIAVKVLENDCSLTDELGMIQNLLSTRSPRSPNLMILDVNNYHTFKTIDAYSYYLKALGKMPVFTVSFEDPKNHPPLSDVAILPYAGADQLKYNDGKCLYLTGPKYFVLPGIFLNTGPAVIRKNPGRLLVSMGGSDPKNITLNVLSALNKTKIKIQVTIIVGGFSRITDTMVNDEMEDYKGGFSIIRDCKNMAKVISQSDMAIIGSGLIKYETASLGLPSIVISLDPYHSSIMDDFVRYNCVEHLGHADIVKDSQIAEATLNLIDDFEKRQRMSTAGRLMIDGCGVERIFSKVISKLASKVK